MCSVLCNARAQKGRTWGHGAAEPSEQCEPVVLPFILPQQPCWTISIVSPRHLTYSDRCQELGGGGAQGSIGRFKRTSGHNSRECDSYTHRLNTMALRKNKHFAHLLTCNLQRGKGRTWVSDQRLLSSRWSKADLIIDISLLSFLLFPCTLNTLRTWWRLCTCFPNMPGEKIHESACDLEYSQIPSSPVHNPQGSHSPG